MTPSIGPGSNPLSFNASWTCFTLPWRAMPPLRRRIVPLLVLLPLSVALPESVLEEPLDNRIEPGWLWSELLKLLLPADHAGAMPTKVPASKTADNDKCFRFIFAPFHSISMECLIYFFLVVQQGVCHDLPARACDFPLSCRPVVSAPRATKACCRRKAPTHVSGRDTIFSRRLSRRHRNLPR